MISRLVFFVQRVACSAKLRRPIYAKTRTTPLLLQSTHTLLSPLAPLQGTTCNCELIARGDQDARQGGTPAQQRHSALHGWLCRPRTCGSRSLQATRITAKLFRTRSCFVHKMAAGHCPKRIAAARYAAPLWALRPAQQR